MSASIDQIEAILKTDPDIEKIKKVFQAYAEALNKKNEIEKARLDQTERQLAQRERELQREHAISERMLALEGKIEKLLKQLQDWQEKHGEEFPTIMEAFTDLRNSLLLIMKGLDFVLPEVIVSKQKKVEHLNLVELFKETLRTYGNAGVKFQMGRETTTKIGNIDGDFSGVIAGQDGRQE